MLYIRKGIKNQGARWVYHDMLGFSGNPLYPNPYYKSSLSNWFHRVSSFVQFKMCLPLLAQIVVHLFKNRLLNSNTQNIQDKNYFKGTFYQWSTGDANVGINWLLI